MRSFLRLAEAACSAAGLAVSAEDLAMDEGSAAAEPAAALAALPGMLVASKAKLGVFMCASTHSLFVSLCVARRLRRLRAADERLHTSGGR